MNDDGSETFEGFGTCGEITTQTHQDNTSAKWADALVDEVFNDPDCERLQVTSIIFAIQEMGYPKAEQLLKLEQQLDPKKEGLTVDKPTLRQVALQWLKLCEEGKEVDKSFEAEENGTNIVHPNNEASSFRDVQRKKDDHFKNEISGLVDTMLSASEEKVKSLQLDNDALKKSLKNLQTTLQDHKVHAEESKATLDEFLLLEESKRIAQVSELENQLTLAKDQLDIVAKDNEELSANKIDDNRIIKDLRDELVMKCNELDEIVQENGILKSHLEQQSERLKYAEIETYQLKSTNVELMEHGSEWKRTIQDLREENDMLRKKILVMSSRFKKGETVSNSNSDLGSDSSNIGEVSIFSPDCFSSPLASEKLSAELAESVVQEVITIDTTHRIPRPINHATEVASSLVNVHKRLRKRKLFGIPALESLPDPKRFRPGGGEDTSMVGLYQKGALPLERATSFAINSTISQNLLEALRHTLCIHPHLFGCIRDLVARQVSSDIIGTELRNNYLTSLFYELCTAQQSKPFCGRQFLRAICEELPTQFNPTDVQSSNEFGIERFNNDDASQDNPLSTYTVEFKSNVQYEVPQELPPLITDGIGFQSDSAIHAQHSEGAAEVLLHNNLNSSITELEATLPPSDLVNKPSSSAGNKTVANSTCCNAAGINGNIAINSTVLSHGFLESNPHTSELELIPSSSLHDQDNLMLPTDRKLSNEFVLGASGSLFCKKRTKSSVHNDEGTEGKIIDFGDFDVYGPENSDSLYNNISGVMNQSSSSVSADVTGSVPTCSTLEDEMCVQAIGSGGCDESDGEFHSSQSLLLEPSFEMYSDCNSELLDSSSLIDLETLDSPPGFGVDSQYPAQNEASRAGCLDKCVKRLKPSKNLSIQPVPFRCFKFMVKISLFVFSLLILLFFLYLVLSKAVLENEEYQNFLFSLGGKSSQNGIPPW